MKILDPASLLDASASSMGVTHAATHTAIATELKALPSCFFLDLGCHEGDLTAAIFKARAGSSGMTFGTGVDRVPEHLVRYRSRFHKAVAFERDLEVETPFDFKADDFNAGVVSFVLEHLTVAGQERLLREICRLVPLLVLGVHRMEGFENVNLPKVEEEPGRLCFTVPGGLPPMRLGLPGYYERVCKKAGFKTVRKAAVIRTPKDPRLGVAADTEASLVYVAQR